MPIALLSRHVALYSLTVQMEYWYWAIKSFIEVQAANIASFSMKQNFQRNVAILQVLLSYYLCSSIEILSQLQWPIMITK